MSLYSPWNFVLLALIFAYSNVEALPSHHLRHEKTARAIYIQSNQATNAVVAIPIGKNGTLMDGKSTCTDTGGAGATLINSMTGQPEGPDALGSQGSVTVAGNVDLSKVLPRLSHR